jgi:thioredoxin reductase
MPLVCHIGKDFCHCAWCAPSFCGLPPARLLERGRAEVRGYGGEVTTGEVTAVGGGLDPGFTVALADERVVLARRLLVTSGLVDNLPDIPGLRERWGRDVVHCPYCHGWEVRDQPIGVLASGPVSVHQALLFRQLSDDVVYFRQGTVLDEASATRLAARGIRLVDGEVSAVVIADDRVAGVRLGDGSVVPRQALAVAARMTARAGFLADLGLKASEHPSGMGSHIPADPAGRTDAPGVWAAGNVTDLAAQVGTAAAAGALAGAVINADLVEEETRQAVPTGRTLARAPATHRTGDHGYRPARFSPW